jgi:hypothetical protein
MRCYIYSYSSIKADTAGDAKEQTRVLPTAAEPSLEHTEFQRKLHSSMAATPIKGRNYGMPASSIPAR